LPKPFTDGIVVQKLLGIKRMSAEIAAPPNFAGIDRDALGVDPRLHLAATYVRAVEASIARVWENIFDWEHFPVLHAEYFRDLRLLEEHARGWRVAVTRQPGGPDRRIVIELDAERQRARYRVRIIEGDGARTEIWTLLATRDANRTAVEVRFYLPRKDPISAPIRERDWPQHRALLVGQMGWGEGHR